MKEGRKAGRQAGRQEERKMVTSNSPHCTALRSVAHFLSVIAHLYSLTRLFSQFLPVLLSALAIESFHFDLLYLFIFN